MTVAKVQVCFILYQQTSNAELASLAGLIAEKYPEIDDAEIAQAIQNRQTTDYAERGTEILRKYGFFKDETASESGAALTKNLTLVLVIAVTELMAALMLYFGWLDWRRNRQIKNLVKYLQDLSNKIYDLKLEENTEDEMSILTNELYKITVLLKEAAENNHKLAKNLETALADISHQLKTPLTSLQIMVDSIYDDAEMPTEVRQDFLRSISQQIETMSGLVSTLLHLARIDNGSLKMDDQEIVIGEVLEKAQQNLAVLADLQGIAVELEGDLAAKIRLDPRWQTEALTNIMKNAIEHSKANDGQKVLVKVADCALFLRIDVIDTGEGMSLHDQKHVFERFYRAAGSTKNSVGIGLAFAKAVIKADNGQIMVDSKLGEGTRFTVRYFR